MMKPCGCPDDGTSCLHGIPEAIGTSEDFPITSRSEYLGISREPFTYGTPDGKAVFIPISRELFVTMLTKIPLQHRFSSSWSQKSNLILFSADGLHVIFEVESPETIQVEEK